MIKHSDALMQIIEMLAKYAPSGVDVRVIQIGGRPVPKRMQLVRRAKLKWPR